MEYAPNFQAQAIAERIIDQHHPHLKGVKIAHVYSQPNNFEETGPSKPKTKRPGKAIKLAKASLIPDRYKDLLEDNYQGMIVYDRDAWEFMEIHQHEALVDHELSHFGRDEDGLYLCDHDVEEFRAILERHGYWRDGLREFVESGQRGLFETNEHITGEDNEK